MSLNYEYTADLNDPQPSNEIPGDHFGASIVSVIYLLSGVEVIPTDGEIIIEWSQDGSNWNQFVGGVINVTKGFASPSANGVVRYIRASGTVTGADSVKIIVWMNRVGYPGIPHNMINRDYLLVESADAFDVAAKYGRALSSSYPVTIPANSEYSINIDANSGYVVRFVRAKNLFIEYYNGNPSGNLVEMAGFVSMNGYIESGTHASFNVYDQHPTGIRVVSDDDEVSEPYYANGSFSIELNNNTNESITTYVSIGIESVGDILNPYMLYSGLQIQSDTEMSDYDG